MLPPLASRVLLVLTIVLTAVPAVAQPTCEFWDGDGLHLAGRVGDADVTVYLHTGWPSRGQTNEESNGAAGLILDARRWLDTSSSSDRDLVALDGRLLAGCQLELEELIGGATWRARIVSRDRVEGTRAVDGRTEPLSFGVTAPFDCTAGPWKTFDAAAWPVTYEYPASARLVDGISCPDVSRLAWDAEPLTIEHIGVQVSPLPDGGRRTRVGPFVSDEEGHWVVDDRDRCLEPSDDPDDEPMVDCGTATISSWHGFRVVQGASTGEDRGYRPGGGSYLGQGSGRVYYAFLLGDAAILVTSDDVPERIADLDAPPPPDRRSTSSMAERIVRSVKRR